MIDITFHGGQIIAVKKSQSGSVGPSAKITYKDRDGNTHDLWFFMEDLSAFNEIKEPE